MIARYLTDLLESRCASVARGLSSCTREKEKRMYYAKPLAKLVGELEKLPGIGPKSAQRLAFHILRSSEEESRRLVDAIADVKTHIKMCPVCFNFTD
ncbi:MAG TPA: hypothetical protein PLP86_05615, partial [Armatimonadota bacterium]|nr:hypothetical protein [Armatimonadota bacterium]